jgi:hypothetical protein
MPNRHDDGGRIQGHLHQILPDGRYVTTVNNGVEILLKSEQRQHSLCSLGQLIRHPDSLKMLLITQCNLIKRRILDGVGHHCCTFGRGRGSLQVTYIPCREDPSSR